MNMREPRSIDEELYKRVLLTHRFGLENRETSLKGNTYSVEELSFEVALDELKKSYTEFMTSKEHIEKLLILFKSTFNQQLKRFSIKESNILIHNISSTILEFYSPSYLEQVPKLLAQNKILVLPIKTFLPLEGTKNVTEYIKGIVLFEDQMIKIDGLGAQKLPGLRLYRIKSYDSQKMSDIIEEFLLSFEHPLETASWDKKIHALTEAEKIRHITKKEQAVGNASWLTSKLLAFAIIFAIVFKFCKSQGLRDLEIYPIALSIAESWYKLFIVDDRNRAVQDYLDLHNFMTTLEPLSVVARIQNIKAFLKTPHSQVFPADKDILNNIYLKSLNWLLADYLKKGDIGEAYALIEEEAENEAWNPLFYAARNGKVAIAELLASHVHYVNGLDDQENTPLHWAALYGRYDICKMFLRYKNKNKINIVAQNKEGDTHLHLAIRHNKLDVADLLIKEAKALLGVSTKLFALKNQQNETVLKVACEYGRIETIERLLNNGASLEGINISDYSAEVQKVLKNPPKPMLGSHDH
jgi:hypothetical protein